MSSVPGDIVFNNSTYIMYMKDTEPDLHCGCRLAYNSKVGLMSPNGLVRDVIVKCPPQSPQHGYGGMAWQDVLYTFSGVTDFYWADPTSSIERRPIKVLYTAKEHSIWTPPILVIEDCNLYGST